MFLKPLWVTTPAIVTTAGGIAGYLFGGIDGLIIALVAFVTADYLTGVMAAISEKRLSSAIGFKGIFRKIIIFTLVRPSQLSSTCTFLGDTGVLRTATIFFYISNEGISLLENATRLGLIIFTKMTSIMHS